MNEFKQLSLAQALGNLSKGKEAEKLIGKKVLFKRSYNNRAGSRGKNPIITAGTIIDITRIPGCVLIETESGGLFSRSLDEVWEDVVNAGVGEGKVWRDNGVVA